MRGRKEVQKVIKTKVDYAFKSHVLKDCSELISKAKKSIKTQNFIRSYYNDGVIYNVDYDYPTYLELICYYKDFGIDAELKEAFKIVEATHKRTTRLNKRIKKLLTSGQCIFITLTFNDNTLNTTTEKERRIKVVRYLKSLGGQYVANIDYGKTNHREHYHALIQCDNIDYSKWYQNGAINTERVRLKSKTDIKLSKYIAKLTNHAIKETTKRQAIIYSR